MTQVFIRSIKREYVELLENAKLVTCHLNAKFKEENNLLELIGEIGGPTDTPYETGIFLLDISYSARHPFVAPVIKFITPIWHPNISTRTGQISLDVLGTKWSPSQTLTTLLLSIQALLAAPEPDHPLEPFIGKQCKENANLWAATARYWTAIYAGGLYTNAKLDEVIQKCMANFKIDKKSALLLLSKGQMSGNGAALVYFQELTGLSEAKARLYLSKNNFNLEDALEVYRVYERNCQ